MMVRTRVDALHTAGARPLSIAHGAAAIRSARDRSREAETALAGSVHESPARRDASKLSHLGGHIR